MECRGYNGTVSVEGETLTITHAGLTAKAGGLVCDQPRHIPLQALSGVRFKAATRLVNGWLTSGVAGVPPAQLGASTDGSDPSTVIFRHKDKKAFEGLHEYLQGVVAYNREQGVDPSAFAMATGGQTRADLQREQRAVQGLAVYGRQDIADAVARMGWKLGGGRELKNLAGHLLEGETIRLIGQGTYQDDQGISVLTDRRLLFLFQGVLRQAKEDFPLRLISSVQTKSGFTSGELRVFASGNSACITNIVKPDLEPLAEAIRQGISAAGATPAPSPPEGSADSDPYEDLKKLAGLRDAGILTDAEYETKKRSILERM